MPDFKKIGIKAVIIALILTVLNWLLAGMQLAFLATGGNWIVQLIELFIVLFIAIYGSDYAMKELL